MDTASAPVVARLTAPAATEPTAIAILSDLHLSLEETGTWRVAHRTRDRLRAAVGRLNDREVDAVLFAGDLVNDGRRRQFDLFDDIVSDLRHPFYAIPGNHDLFPTDGDGQLSFGEFERRYTPGRLPYHERIGGIDLLALSSNASKRGELADTWEGRISPSELAWLSEKLTTTDAPVIAIHHALPGTRELWRTSLEHLPVDGGSPSFTNGNALLDVLKDGEAPLVITAHLHFPAVVNIDGVREFTLPSLGPYPSGITLLESDTSGTVVRFESVVGYEDRVEALVHGLDHNRVQLAAAQLAGLPLVDEWTADRPAPATTARQVSRDP